MAKRTKSKSTKTPARKRAATKPTKTKRAKPTKTERKRAPVKASTPKGKRTGTARAGHSSKPSASTRSRKPTKAQLAARKRELVNAARREARAAERARKERKNELGRRRRKRARSERVGDERGYFATVLESMADRAPFSMDVGLTEAEPGARTPWMIVGRFEPSRPVSYAELFKVFQRWERDLFLETNIHPQRRAQIRIVYQDPHAKRGESDSIVAHYGPWEGVVSTAAAEVDPGDEDSLANRYRATTVAVFYVYFAAELVNER